jgi:arylsulfatase A-like enzyme
VTEGADRPTSPGAALAIGLTIALLLCALGQSCSRPRRPGIPPQNLLLVTIDDLRPDHLSCYGYMRPTSAAGPWLEVGPGTALDELAATGVLFAEAYAPSGSTRAALASLFTGAGPLETGVIDDHSPLAADVPTLAEVLGRAGFATGACATAPRAEAGELPTRGFQSVATGADDEATIELASHWLQRDLGDGRPFFLWLHLSGPGPDGVEVADAAHEAQLYDEKVVRVLRLLGRFLSKTFDYETSEVEASECWARTLLVITSPHGIELGDHGDPRPNSGLSESLLHVPLLVRHPDSLTGERIFDGSVELADVMPTVLDAFGLAVPRTVRGRSLLALTDSFSRRRFEERPLFSSIGDREFSVRTERWCLIWRPYGSSEAGARANPAAALYDRVADRRELHDVAAAHPALVQELQDRIRAWRATQISPAARARAAAAAGPAGSASSGAIGGRGGKGGTAEDQGSAAGRPSPPAAGR